MTRGFVDGRLVDRMFPFQMFRDQTVRDRTFCGSSNEDLAAYLCHMHLDDLRAYGICAKMLKFVYISASS